MSPYPAETAARVLKVLSTAGKLSGDWGARYLEMAPAEAAEVLGEYLAEDLERESWVVKILCRAFQMTESTVAAEQLSPDLFKRIPKNLVDVHQFLPLGADGRFLKVGSVTPLSSGLKAQIKGVAGLNVEFSLIAPSIFKQLRGSRVAREALDQSTAPDQASQVKPRRTQKWNAGDDSLVTDFCNDILLTSIETGTSDIHIEGFRDFARVRLRRDGVLKVHDEYTEYLFKNYGAVVTRFKIMANCDIAEKRIAQDGAITVIGPRGDDIDLRFNTVPTKYGERIVMRILAGDPALSLDKLGFDANDYQKILQAITAPQGMVLVTGPTGSGKTTTLYGALQYINKPELNIMTAEDPIEYYLEGAGQVQANERVGLSFANILRSFLRQDPEVILVGEIRDSETVEIAVKAALTGHLLLSTLHTNDAVSTINRLLNMGVPNFMVASALSLVVSQRLARKSCQNCLEPDPAATPESLVRIGFTAEQAEKVKPMKGFGCRTCGGSGYKGRQGIYEVLRVSPKVEAGILQNMQTGDLLKLAKSEGFLTMQDIGRQYIARHLISLEEFQRTLVMDT